MSASVSQPGSVSGGWRRQLPWLAGIILFMAPLLLWPQARAATPLGWVPTGAGGGGTLPGRAQSGGVSFGALKNAAITNNAGLTILYRWSSVSLLRSADEGRTWAKIGDGLPTAALGSLQLLALEPGSERSVYAVAGPPDRQGLYRSLDSGSRFDLLYQPLGFNPTALAVATQPGNDLLALAGQNRLALSSDGGANWSPILAPGDVTAIAMTEQSLLAAGPGWVGFTNAGSDSWQTHPLPADIRPEYLVVASREREHIYLGHNRGLWRSEDGGATWSPVHPPTRGLVTALAVDPLVWQSLAVADSIGNVWRSNDWGLMWARIPGPTAAPIRHLFVIPGARDRLLATAGHDLWWIQQIPVQPTPTPTATSTSASTATPTATLAATLPPTSTPPATATSASVPAQIAPAASTAIVATLPPRPARRFPTARPTAPPQPTAMPTLAGPTLAPLPTRPASAPTSTPVPPTATLSPPSPTPASPTPASPTPAPTATPYR